jgi:putative copper resistance protein D
MVGLALLASGLLGAPQRDASQFAGFAAFVVSGLALLQLGALALELDGQAPLLDSMQARGLLAQAVIASFAGLFGVMVQSDRARPVLLLGATVAIVPPLLTGHARTASNTILTSVALVLHAFAAMLWIGGLLGVCWMVVRDNAQWPAAVRRFSPLALGCVVAIAVSGIVTMLGHISFGELLTSAYGAVIILKAVMFVGLAAFGWLQRRYVIGRGDTPRQAFVLIAGCELLVMALAVALATGLAQTPPPS